MPAKTKPTPHPRHLLQLPSNTWYVCVDLCTTAHARNIYACAHCIHTLSSGLGLGTVGMISVCKSLCHWLPIVAILFLIHLKQTITAMLPVVTMSVGEGYAAFCRFFPHHQDAHICTRVHENASTSFLRCVYPILHGITFYGSGRKQTYFC